MDSGPQLGVAFRSVVFVGMVLFAIVLGYEVWRRHRRPGSLAPEQYRRRLLGGILLEADLLLWLLADFALRRLPPAGQLAYLSFALLFLFVPVYMALQESLFIMRQYARSRADLIRSLGQRRPDPRNNGHGQ